MIDQETTRDPSARTAQPPVATQFEEAFADLFESEHPRLFRYLDRLSGDPDLAGDIAQDVFVRLHHRGSLPDRPAAWLITVALNLFRNARNSRSRRRRLLTRDRASRVHADPPADPALSASAVETARRVRTALDRLPVRDRELLLLRAEGFAYRDMADALDLNEASIGTLLARARRAFRDAWEDAGNAH